MSHLVPTTLVDSSGSDATDVPTHSVRVNVVAGGAGGGAVTVADGADVAQGSTVDAAWVAGAGTVISLLKKIASAGGSAVSIADGADTAQGAVADAAWSGAGSGTIVSILKRIGTWAGFTGLTDTQLRATPVPVSGTVSETYTTASSTATWTNVTALNTAATVSTIGLATVNFSVRKTGSITVGAVTVEVSADGTNYNALVAADSRFTGGSAANPYSLVTGLFPIAIIADVAAYQSARLRLSTAITGAGSVDVRADSTAASNSTPLGAVTVSGAVNQGNNNATIAQAWKIQVTDGTTGPTKVQPASTAPIATDLALTVALSPNGATVQANAGTNLNTSALALDATLTGRTAKVQITDGTRDGTVKAASTLPALTDTAVVTTQRDPLPAGTNVLGHVIADTGSTTAVTGNVTVVQATPANLTATVTQLALTKGTQGATGVSTQDLKDAGRNMTNFFTAAVVATTTAEVMQSMTGYKSGAAVGATVTPAVVTAGKTYRVQSVEITLWAVTAIGGALVRLRANLSGAGVVTSPLVKVWQIGIPAIFTAGSAMTYTFEYPDGLEFAAGTGIAVGVIGEAADGTTGTAIGKVLVSVNGYEY